MRDTLDAQLPPTVEADRQIRCRQLHEGGVIHPRLHQIFGKIHADAGAGRIGLNLIVGHPEAVFADGILQGGGRVIPRLQSLRQPQSLHRIAPPIDRL